MIKLRQNTRTFIDEVLNDKNEWGYIGIESKGSIFGNPNCEFKWGKLLNELPETYLSKKVISVRARGGWSRMDYLLNVEAKPS